MPFIDFAYSYLALGFLLAFLFTKGRTKAYDKNFIATLNTTLIFFLIYKCYNYYQLYRMAEMFGVSISFEGILKLMSTNKAEAFKNIAVLVIPFFFLYKKLSANIFLTLCMLVLIKWDFIQTICEKIIYQGIKKPSYTTNFSWFDILNYGCLFISIYALLFLLKRLPHQAK